MIRTTYPSPTPCNSSICRCPSSYRSSSAFAVTTTLQPPDNDHNRLKRVCLTTRIHLLPVPAGVHCGTVRSPPTPTSARLFVFSTPVSLSAQKPEESVAFVTRYLTTTRHHPIRPNTVNVCNRKFFIIIQYCL